MPFHHPRWIRPRHPLAATPDALRPARGRLAEVHFIALLDGARIDGALERAREEIAREPIWNALEIDVRARAIDGGRLDEVLAGRAGMTLSRLPEHERWEIDRCQWYASIAATAADPPALDVLQAAIHVLAVLADEDDLLIALDRATARWTSPAALLSLPPERRFSLDEHVDVVAEAVERRPGAGHVVRSRGLPKLARPDVCARVPRRDAERVSEIIRDLARLLADGDTLLPGDRVSIPGLPPLTLIPRTDDALSDAPKDTAPLYELRDLATDGTIGPDCRSLLSTLHAARAPKPRLKVLK